MILRAARREWDNPRGLSSESLGEHSVAIAENSGVYLTCLERMTVRRAATGRRSGYVGSLRTPSGYAEAVPSL